MTQKHLMPHPSRRAERRSSFRFLVTIFLTTGMVATGGFGALPDNPITQVFQEEIGQNLPEQFLSPINSYLDQLSVPTVKAQTNSNPSLDMVGLIFNDSRSESPETLIPLVASTETPSAVHTDTPSHTPSFTFTPSSFLTATSTPTLTSTPSLTPTRLCSRPSASSAVVTFFNGSSQPIDIYLVDSACKLTLISALGAQQSITQETYIGQLWWFIDTSTGHLISDYIVSSANEFVDVSSGTVVVATSTSTVTATTAPFRGFSVSNVLLTNDLSQSGTAITVASGQGFNVSYNFRIFNDPCPGCITQLITGLGTAGTHGEWCAYDGVPGIFPGESGSENTMLFAPEASGTYPVVVEYHWQFSCADALVLYGSRGAVSPQVIGQITVP